MTDSALTLSSQSPAPSRGEALALALKTVVPHKTIRIHVARRTIYTFMKIGCKDDRSMSGALSDPTVPRQTAYLVAFDDRDTFQMGYARNGEESQTVYDIPLSRLAEAVADLKAAGF